MRHIWDREMYIRILKKGEKRLRVSGRVQNLRKQRKSGECWAPLISRGRKCGEIFVILYCEEKAEKEFICKK
jgi:hypothetical protein